MKRGSKLFVRIDYKNEEKELTDQDFQDHYIYVKNIAKERYYVGGGFSNINGGMSLFKAESNEEALKIAKNDPIIERGFFRYEFFEWDLLVVSKKTVDS